MIKKTTELAMLLVLCATLVSCGGNKSEGNKEGKNNVNEKSNTEEVENSSENYGKDNSYKEELNKEEIKKENKEEDNKEEKEENKYKESESNKADEERSYGTYGNEGKSDQLDEYNKSLKEKKVLKMKEEAKILLKKMENKLKAEGCSYERYDDLLEIDFKENEFIKGCETNIIMGGSPGFGTLDPKVGIKATFTIPMEGIESGAFNLKLSGTKFNDYVDEFFGKHISLSYIDSSIVKALKSRDGKIHSVSEKIGDIDLYVDYGSSDKIFKLIAGATKKIG